MKSWYKLAQQENFDFFEDVGVAEPPIPPEIINAPKNIDMLDELIENCSNKTILESTLTRNGFNWQIIVFPVGQIITVNVDNKLYVIDDPDFPETKDANEWVDELYEHELYIYLPPSEDEDYWNDIQPHTTVYHSTTEENLNDIKLNGLEPRNETRGISNRGTPSAVFANENSEETESYGNILIEIHVGQMKADNYMPNVSKETPIEEVQVRSTLAYKIGLPYYEPSTDYSSEGMSEATIIFYATIPPKYLTFQ